MKLFDAIERTDLGPALHSEPAFHYLNRTARPDAARVRDMLESWFTRYSDSDRSSLRGRFRSPNDWYHGSAFFELFLHELLSRMGCRVEVHPQMASTDRRPDFFVRFPAGQQCIIEATLAGQTREDAAARARINRVYDAIDRLESPDFWIELGSHGTPSTSPSGSALRSRLRLELQSLDYAEIVRAYATGKQEAIPEWHFQHEGWHLIARPLPKGKFRGVRGIRPIGMTAWAGFSNARDRIRRAVLGKMGAYGVRDQPYVVAVDATAVYAARIDVVDALFGTEQSVITLSSQGSREITRTRSRDGVWMGKRSPKNRRISAVVIFTRLTPWSIGRGTACLYHNPWASNPYSSELTRLPQAVFADDRAAWSDGESIGSIFGLPPEWPED